MQDENEEVYLAEETPAATDLVVGEWVEEYTEPTLEVEPAELVEVDEPEPEEEPEDEVEVEEPTQTGEEWREILDREREGLRRIFGKRKSVEKAQLAWSKSDRETKAFKKRWEAEVEELDQIILEVEEDQEELPLEKAGFLTDPRKQAINTTFAKPEVIPPLPAEDAEEFYRRKKRDTRFAGLLLKPKIVEILAGAGYHTVLDLDKLHEAGADITSIRCEAGTITEKRAEEIREVLGRVAESWVQEWTALHPEPEVEVEPVMVEGAADA